MISYFVFELFTIFQKYKIKPRFPKLFFKFEQAMIKCLELIKFHRISLVGNRQCYDSWNQADRRMWITLRTHNCSKSNPFRIQSQLKTVWPFCQLALSLSTWREKSSLKKFPEDSSSSSSSSSSTSCTPPNRKALKLF